jgi:archaeosortase A (PGF-CTERM-specific)
MVASLLLILAGLALTSKRWGRAPAAKGAKPGPSSNSPTGRWPEGHLLRAAGWIGFGVFWLSWAAHFAALEDPVNFIACFGALPVFLFLAMHEHRSFRWRDEYAPLRFAAKASVLAGLLFYLAYGVRPIGELLIGVVGGQTVQLLNGIQPGYASGQVGMYEGNNELSMPVHWRGLSYIHIVIACTAIQALLVSVAFIANVEAPWKRKALTLGIVAVPIYLLNLLRNVVVVYLVYNGITDFEFAHNVIGKVLISLLGLFTLMFLAFWLLPQMYEVINGLFDLPWRSKPGHDYKANIGRLVNRLVPPKANGRGG